MKGDDLKYLGMHKLKAMIADWQEAQFPNATLQGAAEHLARETAEAAEELADCFFMSAQCERLGGMPVALPEHCWDAIVALGHSPYHVIVAKLAKNKARKWPAKPDADGVYEAQDDDEDSPENQG
jgi:hypothetical protein